MQENYLRPMSIGSIIDRVFKLYRNNFTAIILFSLLIGGTSNLIVSLLRLGSGAFQTDSALGAIYSSIMYGESLDDILYNLPTASSGGFPILSTILALVVSVFVTPLVTGGVAFVTLAVCHGWHEKGAGWFLQVKKLYPKLLVTQLATFVITVAFFIALMIPLVIIMFVAVSGSGSTGVFIVTMILVLAVMLAALLFLPCFSLIFPVAIHESRFGFKAFGRAWQLFRRRFWKSVGVMFLSGLIVYVLSLVLGMIVAFLPGFLSTILTSAVNALLTPITVITASLLYLDIRMTVEGYDLELRSAAMRNMENPNVPNE